jgi:hypothetical protein
MRYIYSIIKADYLQRTRSYSFLITLAVAIYAAYAFVPPPTARYTTLSMVGYKGVYNSAWVGHVSAMMTTIMVSLYGFFLVSGGIKKDIDTGVGYIVATTSISNFGYLLSKALSNFLVLLTIMAFTFAISIVMFFIRSTGGSFHVADFVLPYVLFAMPALFTISSLAIILEVLLGKRIALQYVAFIFLFAAITANANKQDNETAAVIMDPYGIRTMTTSIKNKVNTQYHADIKEVSMGFNFSKRTAYKSFEWNGINFTGIFLLSRLMWIIAALALLFISSLFFHRFDIKQTAGRTKKKKKPIAEIADSDVPVISAGFNKTLMPPLVIDYNIFPFVKTELLLLIRKGSKWFWLINAGACASLIFTPLHIAHFFILPILWFLQVTRWSELATKEKTNRLHYFTYASYKPLFRMLPAQIIAGILLALVLALPLIIRYAINFNLPAIISILNGAIFIVLLAVCLGIVSGGKKLYEIMFFLLTYILVNNAPFADYLGSIQHPNTSVYIATVFSINLLLLLVSFTVRNYQARHL